MVKRIGCVEVKYSATLTVYIKFRIPADNEKERAKEFVSSVARQIEELLKTQCDFVRVYEVDSDGFT